MPIGNAMIDRVEHSNWRDYCVPADEPALICSDGFMQQSFRYWRGATGRRYLHTVYPLVECPAIPKANFIVVRRNADGSRTPLSIGQTLDDAASLNLAHLRRQAAQQGGDEIHIHLLAETPHERAAVEADLRTGLMDRTTRPLGTSPAPAALAV